MKKVGTAVAVDHHGVFLADLGGRHRRGRKCDHLDTMLPEGAAVGVLQCRAMFGQRFLIGGFGHSHLAEQARKHVFHRWALHLRHQPGKVEARSVLGQIVVEVRNRLVECDWKAGGVVERTDVGDVALDQHRARLAQLRQRALENLRELGVKVVPEMPARHADAQALEPRGVRGRWGRQ